MPPPMERSAALAVRPPLSDPTVEGNFGDVTSFGAATVLTGGAAIVGSTRTYG